MCDIYLNKLPKCQKNSLDMKCFLYIKTKWNDQDMEIILQDSETGKCYHGLVSRDQLKEVANDLDIPFVEYKQICYEILTMNNNNKTSKFIYELVDDNDDKKQLLIRKLPLNCLYLDINLKYVKNHYDLFETALELLQHKEEALTKHLDIAQKYEKDFVELHENMECMINEKNQLEKRLFKKFITLLNAKKNKILELENRLKKYDNKYNCNNDDDDDSGGNQDSSNDDIPSTSREIRHKRKMITIDSDSSDSNKCVRINEKQHNSNDETFLANTEILFLE